MFWCAYRCCPASIVYTRVADVSMPSRFHGGSPRACYASHTLEKDVDPPCTATQPVQSQRADCHNRTRCDTCPGKRRRVSIAGHLASCWCPVGHSCTPLVSLSGLSPAQTRSALSAAQSCHTKPPILHTFTRLVLSHGTALYPRSRSLAGAVREHVGSRHNCRKDSGCVRFAKASPSQS